MTADARRVDEWMPLFVDKYLLDTDHLTTEQHGAYLLLLMSGWKRGGHLPADDRQLANIARMNPQRWRASKAVLLAFFRHDGTGRLVQKRLTLEVERARRVSTVRAEIGRIGGRSRSKPPSKLEANVKQLVKQLVKQTGKQNASNGEANGVAIGVANTQANDQQKGDTGGSSLRSEPLQGISPLRSEIPTVLASARTARASEGDACKAMRKAGMQTVNPASPTLTAVLDQGMTVDELVEATRVAVARGKGFAWALERAIGQRADAARVALAPAASSPARNALTSAILAASANGPPDTVADVAGADHASDARA